MNRNNHNWNRAALALASLAMVQCAMPPREAWRIVQNQGLVTYLSGEYETPSSSRYLAEGAPLQSAPAPHTPYRPPQRPELGQERFQNRYLAENEPLSSAPTRAPYRPRPQSAPSRPRIQPSASEDREPTPRVVRNEPAPRDTVPTPSRPKPQPTVASSSSSSSSDSDAGRSASEPAKTATGDLPYGNPVSGRPGMVHSPYAGKQQLVDVSGMSPGEPVKCPYSGKLFRVPPSQQAAVSSESAPSNPVPEKPQEPAPTPEPTPDTSSVNPAGGDPSGA